MKFLKNIKKKKNKKGFVFAAVELTIIFAIVAILVGAVFVAIDPARRWHETRNAQRSDDIATILDSIKRYQADNGGIHYTTVENMNFGIYYQIGTAGTGCSIACDSNNTNVSCVNLADIGNNYLTDVPKDPKGGTYQTTGYALAKDSTGAITVEACHPEGEGFGGTGTAPVIKITR